MPIDRPPFPAFLPVSAWPLVPPGRTDLTDGTALPLQPEAYFRVGKERLIFSLSSPDGVSFMSALIDPDS